MCFNTFSSLCITDIIWLKSICVYFTRSKKFIAFQHFNPLQKTVGSVLWQYAADRPQQWSFLTWLDILNVWGLKRLLLTQIPQTGKIFEAPENNKVPDSSCIFYMHSYTASWLSRNHPAPQLLVQHITVVLTINIALCNSLEKGNNVFCCKNSLQLLNGYSSGKMRRLISLHSEAQPRSSSTVSSRIHYFTESSTRTKLLCTCPILTSKQWHNFHKKG